MVTIFSLRFLHCRVTFSQVLQFLLFWFYWSPDDKLGPLSVWPLKDWLLSWRVRFMNVLYFYFPTTLVLKAAATFAKNMIQLCFQRESTTERMCVMVNVDCTWMDNCHNSHMKMKLCLGAHISWLNPRTEPLQYMLLDWVLYVHYNNLMS